MAEFPVISLGDSGVGALPGRVDSLVGRTYMVDMPGHSRGKPSLDAIETISNGGRRDVWVDAGPIDADDVIDLLVAGASAVVIRHGGRYWRDLAIEALGLTENVVLWFGTADLEGVAQEMRWFIGKGIVDFVVWSGPVSGMPEGGRYYSRRKGVVRDGPDWTEWKLLEVEIG